MVPSAGYALEQTVARQKGFLQQDAVVCPHRRRLSPSTLTPLLTLPTIDRPTLQTLVGYPARSGHQAVAFALYIQNSQCFAFFW